MLPVAFLKTRGRPVGIFLFLLCFAGCCVPVETRYPAAPSLLPGTNRMMKTAGFWIGRHPDPDRIFLDPGQIEKLNGYLQEELGLTRDVLASDENMSQDEIRSLLDEDVRTFTGPAYYDRDGMAAGADFLGSLCGNMNLENIPARVPPRFALVTGYADQRVFPTAEPLYRTRGDRDFDAVQTSALDIGTPLRILHESRDRAWLYVFDPLYRGWVEKNRVAAGSREDLERFLRPEKRAVVTSPKGDLYQDPKRTAHHDHARMGVTFPLAGDDAGTGEGVALLLPFRREDGSLRIEKAYASETEVHRGFLALTGRHMLEQAFRLVNAPYGWGGRNGEQDCSRFVQEVFATAGLRLPRNSSKQAEAGLLLERFDGDTPEDRRIRILAERAPGGLTLLYMKGHILLYAGHVDGVSYAIHSLWGYRERTWGGDRVRVTGRVVLSDLTLGKGTKKGSLLERLVSVRMLSPVDTPFL